MNNDRYAEASARPPSQQQCTPRRRDEALHPQASFPVHEADNSNEEEEDDYDDVWPPRMSSSVIRYSTNAPARQRGAPQVYTQGNRRIYVHEGLPPARRTATQIPPPKLQRQPQYEDAYETEIPRRARRRTHWMLSVGVGMVAMLALWVTGSWILQWWQVHQDDATYGRPRTSQTDAVVGHHDSSANPSHFLAINLKRHVVVIECPGGDCTHAVVYLGPTLAGDGQDLTHVTLTFQDLRGDGKLDMVLHIQDQRVVFLNENGSFRPARPGEVPL
jgi:hypothetical protein